VGIRQPPGEDLISPARQPKYKSTPKFQCDTLVDTMRLSGRRPRSFTRPWTERQRVVLLALIALNVAVFVAQLFLEAYERGIVREFFALSNAGLQNAYGWQFFTAMFLHQNAWHLVGSTAALYLLGRDVEPIVGQRHFLLLFLSGAAVGQLGHLFLMPSTTALYGATGGVAAVLMAYATILPEMELSSLLRLKVKHFAWGTIALGAALMVFDRYGAVSHSVIVGGCATGWLYAHLLGFGRPSIVQRRLHQRKAEAERHHHMSAEQFIAEVVDPLLEKIAREGMGSLTRKERRLLAQGQEKLAAQRA
jgi:membrane associated rhomboid family serine protease